MKIPLRFLYAFCLVILCTSFSQHPRTGLPVGITESFENGDARLLAQYFNPHIELAILERQDVYSRAQAQLIVQSFFNRNPVISFNWMYQGGTETSKYAIGRLTSSTGIYRVYLLIKVTNNRYYINQLRIGKERG